MEVGEEGDYIPIATLSPPEWWAAMRAILMFLDCEGQKQTNKKQKNNNNKKQCPQTTTVEEKGKPKQIRTEVPLLTNLTPYRLT